MSSAGAIQIAKCVKNSEDKTELVVDFQTLRQIIDKSSNKLIAIYCIAGNFRSGKSFLLSLCLQYLNHGVLEKNDKWIEEPLTDSFKYNNSCDGVTAGIWLWSEPFVFKNSANREVALYLMDSQGWHDNKTSLWESSVLFSFGTLLSSVMMLNLEKNIKETDLLYLQRFVFNSKLIDEQLIDEPFQKLIIIIRDWISFDDYALGFYDNQSISDRDYVKDKIWPNQEQTPDSQKLRELIVKSYEKVSASLLPYPGEIVEHNQFKPELMTKRFKATINDLFQQLFKPDNLLVKRLGGKELTGAELFSQAVKWQDDFKSKFKPVMIHYTEANQTEIQMKFQFCLDYFIDGIRTELNSSKDKEQISKLIDSLDDRKTVSFEMFDSDKRLEQLDSTMKSQYGKKLLAELTYQAQMYTDILQTKLDHLHLIGVTNELQQKIKQAEREMEETRKQAENAQGQMRQILERQFEHQKESQANFQKMMLEQQRLAAEKDERYAKMMQEILNRPPVIVREEPSSGIMNSIVGRAIDLVFSKLEKVILK